MFSSAALARPCMDYLLAAHSLTTRLSRHSLPYSLLGTTNTTCSPLASCFLTCVQTNIAFHNLVMHTSSQYLL